MLYEEQVEFHDQGKLAGILHLPPPKLRPSPVVVFCPGKNGERYEVHRLAVKFARRLANIGVSFFRFDYYGVGLSDGFYHEVTNSTKVSNALRAIEFLRNYKHIVNEGIACLGFSDGARTALMAANRTNITKLLLWSPIFNEYSGNYPNKKKPRFMRHPQFPKVLVMPWLGLWTSIQFYQELRDINLEEEIKSYQEYSYILFGNDDHLFNEEKQLLDPSRFHLYQNITKHRVKGIHGAGHLFNSVELENQLMEASIVWLRKHLLLN